MADTQVTADGGQSTTTNTTMAAGFKELTQFKPSEIEWHSILTGEDLLVAALRKSLRRSGAPPLADDVLHQGMRDVIGEIMTRLPEDAVEARKAIRELLVGDGSGGGDELMPEPNP